MEVAGNRAILTVKRRPRYAVALDGHAQVPRVEPRIARKYIDKEGNAKRRDCQGSRGVYADSIPFSRYQSVVEDAEYQFGQHRASRGKRM